MVEKEPPVIARRGPVTVDGPGADTLRPGTCRVATIRDGEYELQSGYEGLARVGAPGTAAWVDLERPTEHDVERVRAALRLHPLVVEDIVEGNQRSKIEATEDHIHIVLFVLRYAEDRVVASEVHFVVGEGFLLTVHDEGWDPWRTQHLAGGVQPVLTHGPDHLLWALVDPIVDGYFPFIDELGDAIDDLQDAVVRNATSQTLERLFRLKRELVAIRRAVAPIREIFNQLTNRDLALIDEEEILYFRDVYDHLIRLTDEVDNYRELVSGTLDVYLSTVNNNLSLIMKRLTGITVILAGVGAIGGLFGMSEAGPALSGAESPGFWVVVAAALALAIALIAWLRRVDWI